MPLTQEKYTGKLRVLVKKDGTRVLQQEVEQYVPSEGKVYRIWRDVPEHREGN